MTEIRISLPGQTTAVIPDNLLSDRERRLLEDLVTRKQGISEAISTLTLAGYKVFAPGQNASAARCVCTLAGSHGEQCPLGSGTIDGLCDWCRTHCRVQGSFTTIYTGQPRQESRPMYCVSSVSSDPQRRHVVFEMGPALPGEDPRPLRALCGLTNLRYIWPEEHVGTSICHICSSALNRRWP